MSRAISGSPERGIKKATRCFCWDLPPEQEKNVTCVPFLSFTLTRAHFVIVDVNPHTNNSVAHVLILCCNPRTLTFFMQTRVPKEEKRNARTFFLPYPVHTTHTIRRLHHLHLLCLQRVTQNTKDARYARHGTVGGGGGHPPLQAQAWGGAGGGGGPHCNARNSLQGPREGHESGLAATSDGNRAHHPTCLNSA